MIAGLLAKIFGTNTARQLKRLRPIVQRINELEAVISALTDSQLNEKTNEFRRQIEQGRSLDEVLPEAYAVVREAGKRTLGQRHFDVQLIGGIVLHQGKIAEMKTGEGKTLTATLPLYLNALSGKGAHLVTVNDYLARRDAQWMSPIYNFLGLSVAALQNSMGDQERKKIYNSDILYATNNELGFDYLRDNMKFRIEDYVQRDLSYAIVDEVDSILIDEARTPLIISGGSGHDSGLYQQASRVVGRLEKNKDYEVDEKARSVQLTESGNDRIEEAFGINNIYAIEHLNLLHHVMQSLRAYSLYKRDFDYVVVDNQVLIVDEFTGRILAGRRYSDGLHQALEAKEGVKIEQETQTLASITLQNYFRLYKKLAGMTGTAATEAEEFYKIYKLDVVEIPTNRPMIRLDKPDLIFLSQRAKYAAIIEDIKKRHEAGQPVLIGTIAVETSEYLSQLLKAQGIPHEVLNAKHHEREAEIVEHAGKPGHITIATNMAGRGTDIKLPPESIAAGGLYILGTERHESRRIDNQLRGRSGRQGDPGESRFYLSLEDDLIRIFGGSLKKNMEMLGMKEDEIIESRLVSRSIEHAQERVEKQNFEIRKHLIEYDDVLNQQRNVVYSNRKEVLIGHEHIYEVVRDFISDTITNLVALNAVGRTLAEHEIATIVQEIHNATLIDKEILHQVATTTNREQLVRDLISLVLEKYDLYRNQSPLEIVQNAEKWLILETIDQAWKQHMLNLDHLKEGIGLRGWGQKNPLIEYKREAFDMFQEMMNDIMRDVMHHLFHLNVARFDAHELERRRERELEALNMVSSSASQESASVDQAHERSVAAGRNEPCPCGSGKKYKKCCGA